jgi:hypothetical protein
MDTENQSSIINHYDRTVGSLEGLPDVIKSQPSTVVSIQPLLGLAETFIVQTVRHRERGDYIFVQSISAENAMRIVLPPKVADAIARQRDSITAKSRSRAAKRVAQDRKDKGLAPAFTKRKPGKRGTKKRAKA